ncbi:MAG: hypothetical protein GC137_00695 [Alphaproteobacteria bacterium]|nr:hypothetical protein [Alphaproteobacteria bacterium]
MTGRPFLFDKHVFDDDPLKGLDDGDRPQYSRNELEKIKKQAFEDGKKTGFQESEQKLTKIILSIIQKIERDLTVLFAAEDDRYAKYETESVHLTHTLFQKLYPYLYENFETDEINTALQKALHDHSTPENIKIQINPDTLAGLNALTEKLEHSLHKNITIAADSTLAAGECHITWDHGGIIQNRQNIAYKTFSHIKQALAERGINVQNVNKNTSSDDADLRNKTEDKAENEPDTAESSGQSE